MIVESITQELVTQSLDELGIKWQLDNDGDVCALLSADSDFHHDVMVFFLVRNKALGVTSFAKDYEVPDGKLLDALIAVNKFNSEHMFPTLYIRDQAVQAEHWIVIDRPVSTDFITHNCIGLLITIIWKTFVEFSY